MKRTTISTLTPGIFGFLGMAAVGWYLAIPTLFRAKTESVDDAPRAHRHPMKSPRDPGLVAEQMNAVRDAGSPSERLRAAIALANSLPPSEFAAWVEGDRFNFRKGPELSVFRMIVFERWIKEDPESLIPWAGRNNHGQAGRALLSLANKNPQGLIDYYRIHPDDKTEVPTLSEVAKNHPALALQRLQEISARGIVAESAWQASWALAELSKNSPAALEAALGTLDPEMRREAENLLSGLRLTASFSTELQALWERPNGWDIFSNNTSKNNDLSSRLIAEIANLPASWKARMAEHPFSFIHANSGKEWFNADLEGAGFSDSQAKRIRLEALDKLVSSDFEFALRNVAEAGLDPYIRSQVIASAINSAKVDRSEIETLIGMIGSEELRQETRDQIKHSDLNVDLKKAKTPVEWLEKLGTMEGDFFGMLDQLETRDQVQLANLRTLFNELPPDQQLNIARMVAANGMNSQLDPGFAGDAIRTYVNHPPAANGKGGVDPVMASSTFAVQLSITDPAAATSWINTLPEGEAKLWAHKNVAANWQQYDPAAVTQWVKTLPADARDQVTEHLKKTK